MQRGNGHGTKAAAPAGRRRKRKRGVKAARVWQREEMIPEGSADCPYILWTKMGSHPWWPARDCTEDEKERHRDVKVRGFRCLRLPTHVHRHKNLSFAVCLAGLELCHQGRRAVQQALRRAACV